MELGRDDYQMILAKAARDPESYKLVERLIVNHFDTIDHLKNTPLWEVFEYEARLLEPMEILSYENYKLKKEVNKLRKQLGMIEKYKED